MFTGIIREVGIVQEAASRGGGVRLRVAASAAGAALAPGGSIAVDGVCLTVTENDPAGFAADVVPETLDRTRLGELAPGARVNLELPVRLDQPLDGHLVQGHVDAVGTVAEVSPRGSEYDVTVEAGAQLAPFLAEKGSVAINGVSLTVTAVDEKRFSVALIPTTWKETNLNELQPGSRVNLEVDLVARYVARLQTFRGAVPDRNPALTGKHLEEMGY